MNNENPHKTSSTSIGNATRKEDDEVTHPSVSADNVLNASSPGPAIEGNERSSPKLQLHSPSRDSPSLNTSDSFAGDAGRLAPRCGDEETRCSDCKSPAHESENTMESVTGELHLGEIWSQLLRPLCKSAMTGDLGQQETLEALRVLSSLSNKVSSHFRGFDDLRPYQAFQSLKRKVDKEFISASRACTNVFVELFTFVSTMHSCDTVCICGANALPKIEFLNRCALRADKAQIFDSISAVFPIRWLYGQILDDTCGPFAVFPESFCCAMDRCWSYLMSVLAKVSRPEPSEVTQAQRERYFAVSDRDVDYPISDRKREAYVDMTTPSTSKAIFVRFQCSEDDGDFRILRLSGRTMQFVDFYLNGSSLIDKKSFVPQANAVVREEKPIREKLHNCTVLTEVAYCIAEILLQCPGWYADNVEPLQPLRHLHGIWDSPSVYMSSQFTLSQRISRPLAVVEVPGLTFFDSQTLYAHHESLREECIRYSDLVYVVSSKEQLSFSGLDGYLFRTFSALALTTPYADFCRAYADSNTHTADPIADKVHVVLGTSKAEEPPTTADFDTIRNQLPSVSPDNVFFVDTSRSLKLALLMEHIRVHTKLPDPHSTDEVEKALGTFCAKELSVVGRSYPEDILHCQPNQFEVDPSNIEDVLNDIVGVVSKHMTGASFDAVLDNIVHALENARRKREQQLQRMLDDNSRPTREVEFDRIMVAEEMRKTIDSVCKDHSKFIRYFVFPMLGRDYRIGRYNGFPVFVPTERFTDGARKFRAMHTLHHAATDPLKDGIRNVNGVHLLWKLSDYIRPIMMHLSRKPPEGTDPVAAITAQLQERMETTAMHVQGTVVSSEEPPAASINLSMGSQYGGSFRPAIYQKHADGKDITLYFCDKMHYEHWLAHVYAVFSEEFTKYCLIELSQALLHNLYIAMQEAISLLYPKMGLHERIRVYGAVRDHIHDHVDRVLVQGVFPILRSVHDVLREDILAKANADTYVDRQVIRLDLNKELLPDVVNVSRKCFKRVCQIYLEGDDDGRVDSVQVLKEKLSEACCVL